MKKIWASAAAFVATIAAGPVFAATMGTFDLTRTYSEYYMNGSKYDDIRNAILAEGHSIIDTSAVTAGFLSTIDVFYTGMVNVNTSPSGAATAAEISALTSWIGSGGILVVGGENAGFTTNANTWLNPFGLNLSGSATNGTWATGSDPLLANGVAGSALGFAGGSFFDAGTYNILATASNGEAAVVSVAIGSGLVIGLGDGNFIDDPASLQSKQFFENIMALADSGLVDANVPLPAALPLFASALAGMGIIGWRRRSAS